MITSPSIRSRSPSGLWAALGLLALAAPLPAAAQADLQGNWKIEQPRVSLPAVEGAVPFTPEGRKRYDANRKARAARQFDYDPVQSLCASPGLPRLMLTPARFHIWQRPGIVTFQFEWNRLYVQVDMTGQTRPPLDVGINIGDSRGHWEGDTLVIDSDQFTDRSLVDALIPHSEDMKLTQRLKLIDPDTLEDRITVEDPQTFTKPWEAVVTYKRQPDGPFPEDICIDRRDAGQMPLPLK